MKFVNNIYLIPQINKQMLFIEVCFHSLQKKTLPKIDHL